MNKIRKYLERAYNAFEVACLDNSLYEPNSEQWIIFNKEFRKVQYKS